MNTSQTTPQERINYEEPFGDLDSMYRFNEHNGTKVTSPDAIYAAITDLMQHMDSDREHLMNVMLNTKNQIIGIEIVSIGTLNACMCHPREIFYPAIANKAASIILVHNHPSGDPEPSLEDVAVAKKIVKAGKLLGIDVLDSIVVGDHTYVSIKEKSGL